MIGPEFMGAMDFMLLLITLIQISFMLNLSLEILVNLPMEAAHLILPPSGINSSEPTNWSTPVVMDPNNNNHCIMELIVFTEQPMQPIPGLQSAPI